jgi:hypothetical protein
MSLVLQSGVCEEKKRRGIRTMKVKEKDVS